MGIGGGGSSGREETHGNTWGLGALKAGAMTKAQGVLREV